MCYHLGNILKRSLVQERLECPLLFWGIQSSALGREDVGKGTGESHQKGGGSGP